MRFITGFVDVFQYLYRRDVDDWLTHSGRIVAMVLIFWLWYGIGWCTISAVKWLIT